MKIGGEDVALLPPWKRDVGMVFQNYALWPHLTVAGNVAFGLEERRWPRERVRERVREVLDLVSLAGYENRRPGELSGGQQQRVAIARTLAIEPRVLLLDEPLSNLDAKLRAATGLELKRLQRRLGLTTVFVTHDQQEAMTIADRLAVLEQGVIQQVGTPRELYDTPANRFVAEFVGSINLYAGRIEPDVDRASGTCAVEIDGLGRVRVPVARIAAPAAVIAAGGGGAVALAFRPHAVRLAGPTRSTASRSTPKSARPNSSGSSSGTSSRSALCASSPTCRTRGSSRRSHPAPAPGSWFRPRKSSSSPIRRADRAGSRPGLPGAGLPGRLSRTLLSGVWSGSTILAAIEASVQGREEPSPWECTASAKVSICPWPANRSRRSTPRRPLAGRAARRRLPRPEADAAGAAGRARAARHAAVRGQADPRRPARRTRGRHRGRDPPRRDARVPVAGHRRRGRRPGGAGPFRQLARTQGSAQDADALRALLVESGLWTAFRTRPFSKVPSPSSTPHAIFVTAIDTHPHAPPVDVAFAGREADFDAGVLPSRGSAPARRTCARPPDRASRPVVGASPGRGVRGPASRRHARAAHPPAGPRRSRKDRLAHRLSGRRGRRPPRHDRSARRRARDLARRTRGAATAAAAHATRRLDRRADARRAAARHAAGDLRLGARRPHRAGRHPRLPRPLPPAGRRRARGRRARALRLHRAGRRQVLDLGRGARPLGEGAQARADDDDQRQPARDGADRRLRARDADGPDADVPAARADHAQRRVGGGAGRARARRGGPRALHVRLSGQVRVRAAAAGHARPASRKTTPTDEDAARIPRPRRQELREGRQARALPPVLGGGRHVLLHARRR